MNFKQWLLEYEGDTFPQNEPGGDPNTVNDARFLDKGINSKYKGPGKHERSGELGEIDKQFGFKPNDPLLKKTKELMRKMRKMMVK